MKVMLSSFVEAWVTASVMASVKVNETRVGCRDAACHSLNAVG